MSHFTFDETAPGFPLTIKSVTFGDEGKKRCQINVRGVGYEDGSSDLQIRVPPATMTINYQGITYNNGASIPVLPGGDRQFTCNVPAIKPAANFTWTLEGATLIQTGAQEDIENQDDSRLVDSSDTEAVTIDKSPGTQTLSCGATNRQDGLTDAEMAVTVTVQVRVPPSTSSMFLSDSTGPLVPDSTVTVNQGNEFTFMCVVRGTRPSVTITWLLQEEVQETKDPDPPVGDELVDTTAEWLFIPRRNDHGRTVKCSASTAETVGSVPAVSVTLQVNGPPDAPIIAGNTQMMENVPVELTCTAEEGYPNEWILAWYNGDTPLSNPATTPTSSGARFSFSSTLTFTPARQDNGEKIICRAERGAVTSAEGILGPLDVQYETFIVNKEDLTVGARDGAAALLRCTAMGNPIPTTQWRSEALGQITNQTQPGKFTVTHTTFSGDDVDGYGVASTLEITEVVGTSDYGVYTCQSSNGIGMVVLLNIELNGRVMPQPPTSVTIDHGQITATSVKVVWTPGNDGGETQWFHVNHREVATSVDFDPDKRSKRIDDVSTEYLLERLSPVSLYEIEVYAMNVNGVSKSVKRNATTLPLNPVEMGIGVTLRQATGAISVEKISQNDNGCLQLEFRLNEQDEWYNYGGCQETNAELMLQEVRSRFCQDSLCSEPSRADVDASRGDVGLIAGIVILILILLVVVVVFLIFKVHRRRVNMRGKSCMLIGQRLLLGF